MNENWKGEVIYLRSYLQLYHTISSSNSLNGHALPGMIYEDIFLPIARARKLTECQGLISI